MHYNFATERQTCNWFGLSNRTKIEDASKTEKNPVNSIHFTPKMALQGTPENGAISLMRNQIPSGVK